MKIIASVFLLVFLAVSCKKHEQPELTPINEDCSCASEVSADFEILELETLPQFDPEGTDSDTIFMNKNVIFRAKEDNAEYTWYIGSEILNTQEVGRQFTSVFAGQDITVSLVVNKPANTICFPNDDGHDSISRTFYVQTYAAGDPTSMFVNDSTLMEGIYRMKSAHLPDSFDVVIDYIDRITQPNEQIDILNYDGLGSNAISMPRNSGTRKTYRGFWIAEQGTFQNNFKGKFLNILDGQATFEIIRSELIGGEIITTEFNLIGRKL
jgi:hypothetical protein